jgi:hypothetical protein
MQAKKDAAPNKVVLILIDGLDGTTKMAEEIAAALKGNKVSIANAYEFQGNDILPAEAFFLGCEKPKPHSFVYIADLFKHINLAGRPCGVFSPGSEKAAKYLAGLVRDSDAALNPELLTGSSANIGKWAKKVISQSF